MTSAELLASFPPFDRLTLEHRAAIALTATQVSFPGGTILFTEGQPATGCWLIQSGHVALGTEIPGRGQVVVQTLGPGDLLGWSWLVPPAVGVWVTVPLLVFCPGAEYGPAKRWPPEYFAALAQMVGQSFPYTQIVALGSPKDAPLAQAIAERAPNVRNLCGQTALGEACALISRANAVVTNDSGLMHVAAALRRPLVAVYGSTDPRHTPPLSELAKVQWLHLECSPCFERECPLGHLNCLRQLSAEQVFGDLRGMLLAQR